MASEVGGDFYTIKKIDGNRWLLCICDISGKGMSAAMVATLLGGTIIFYDFTAGLRNFLETLNTYINKFLNNERFITGTFIIYDEKDSSVELFDMGHSYTYILRNGKCVKPKSDDKSIPLGITEIINPVPVKFKLKKGDVMVIITDGIEEQINPRGERYGIKRVLNSIAGGMNEKLDSMKHVLFEDIKTFKENQAQSDDMTMILLRQNQ